MSLVMVAGADVTVWLTEGMGFLIVKTDPSSVLGEAVTVVEVVQEGPAKEEGARAEIAAARQQGGSL